MLLHPLDLEGEELEATEHTALDISNGSLPDGIAPTSVGHMDTHTITGNIGQGSKDVGAATSTSMD